MILVQALDKLVRLNQFKVDKAKSKSVKAIDNLGVTLSKVKGIADWFQSTADDLNSLVTKARSDDA